MIDHRPQAAHYYPDNKTSGLCSAHSEARLMINSPALMPMLNFAMVLAFATTPFFALLNYILVSKAELPETLALGSKLKLLSIAGLIYLFGFLALFVWWKWFM